MANEPIPQFVSHVPVPLICDGIIVQKVEGSPRYDVSITKTQMGEFQGPIRAVPLYQSPLDTADYKSNDYVKVMVMFHYDVNTERYESAARTYSSYILGKYDPEVLIESDIQNPLSEKGNDRVVVKNKNSEAGVSMTDNYELIMTPGGSVSHTLKALGGGIFKNCEYIRAQNYHRVISHNDPLYNSREHFGMFTGVDPEDEATRKSEIDFPINYRRFVQQTRDPSKWVSVCEGAYAPWVGPNNENRTVDIGKEVLFTRIVNSDKNRITQEYGEIGKDFIMMRVDDVQGSEFTIPGGTGASPGLLGNRFKLSISEQGELEIYAAGSGVPTANFAKFKLTLNADGELKVLAAKKITFSHGDRDESINSIVMDSNGIQVTARAGLTVNGKKLLNENFLLWFKQNQATFGMAGQIPVTIAVPVSLLTALEQAPDSAVGILTKTADVPITGIISQSDRFSTQ